MFRYELRTASKSSNNNSAISNSSSYAGGGALQRAIKKDIESAYKDLFLELAKDEEVDETEVGTNDEIISTPGRGFALFKKAFNDAKLGLLNRPGPAGFFPDKCMYNESSYSQLLYAVCLDLLRDAFLLHDFIDPLFLKHSAFAVFALYTLFQTNPLPRCPPRLDPDDETTDQPHFLPLDLNLKRQERHYYAPLIRIDMVHFNYILQLMDVARAFQPTTAQKRLHEIATDLIPLLQRMIRQPMFERCAYTGPCSAEAWAAHSSRQFPTNPNLHAAQEFVPQQQNPGSTETLESEMRERWKDYYGRDRAAIRLPPPNGTRQSNRIRGTLQTMFQDAPPQPPWTQLPLPGATVPEATDEHDHASEQERWMEEAKTKHLPKDLTLQQRASVVAAMQSLYTRNIPLFPLPEANEQDANEDIAETIVGAESMPASVATSVAETSVGRHALGHLLQQARFTMDRGQTKPSADFLEAGQDSLRNFKAPPPKRRGDQDDEDMSDLSSTASTLAHDDDQSTVAASQIGKNALDTLLRMAASGKKRKAITSRKRKAPPKPNRPKTSSASVHDDDQSTVAASQVGKNALDTLLRMAADGKKSKATTSRKRKAHPKSTQPKTPERARHLQNNIEESAERSDHASSHSEDEDSPSSDNSEASVGKTALNDLLATAMRRPRGSGKS